jgi:hypothetical protein
MSWAVALLLMREEFVLEQTPESARQAGGMSFAAELCDEAAMRAHFPTKNHSSDRSVLRGWETELFQAQNEDADVARAGLI